ncbi:MAG: aldehyde dehydrogenase family protein [Trueperaceae bacterium]|nr:aldehyde dehydrogenase family protein [Trueperaceae bacterium]MCO5174707.1 aldehyde dehydrogenase family protein [Trueperaceae bacterium]
MSVKEIFETLEYGPAPEAADVAWAWLERHGRRFGHFIGGRFVKPVAGETFATHHPGDGKELAQAAQGDERDVAKAVKAARAALPAWRDLGGPGRARYLYALARHVQKHARLLAVLEALDNGKPIRETRDLDVPLVARHFYHHAGWAQLLDKEFPDHEGVGVCAQIIPWNFPLLMLAWKVAPALAAGNTVVLKPAEFTPLTALLFAELANEVGLPAGVFNVVTGDGRTGAALVEADGIDKVAFTGSTEVGRIIRRATAGRGVKLSLELGGKSPFVVFDDADLDSAVEGVVDAIWFNQGQVCCAGSRLLVQESVAKRVEAKLIARMETLREGPSLDKGIDIGAIIAPVQLAKIERLVEQGRAEGARCYQPSWSAPKDGWYYPPTLFTEVSPAAAIAQEEIFGPVIVSLTFRTPAEAVELANDTRYGLAASVWTENVNLALDIAPKLKAGVVWVNCTNQFDAAAGFGGYRESGFGREGGREGMFEYLKPRYEARLARYAGTDLATPAPASDLDAGLEGAQGAGAAFASIDRTPKLYIGGKQKRPDGNYSYPVLSAAGARVGDAPLGNRKDVRDAVEAAAKSVAWTQATAHARAQVLYYVAENLAVRAPEFEERLRGLVGGTRKAAGREVEKSVDRLFSAAAYADKYDGRVHPTPMRNVTLAMNEAYDVLAVVCPDEAPLLAFVSLVAPALAMGNRVVAVPSARWPLLATDLYQVFDTSDVPGGAINIVTGVRDELAKVLAQHDAVEAMWYVGSAEGSAMVERESAGNLKATWVNFGKARDWYDDAQAAGPELLRRAVRVKNIWVPYGE